jgi:IS5 family transposase
LLHPVPPKKDSDKAHDPQMQASQTGNQWHFGMKAHIDADLGLAHTVRGTSGHVQAVLEGNSLLHGQEVDACGGAGNQSSLMTLYKH